MVKLTTNRIDAMACPAGRKDALVFDDEARGLAVRVSAGGGKTYVAQYTFGGSKRRVPLGSCGAVSLADARAATRAIMGAVAAGRDPAAERKAAAEAARQKAAHEALTLSTLLDNWRDLHLVAKRPRYAAEAVRALRHAFAADLDRPAADLSRAAVVKTLDALAREGSTAMAARTIAYGRAAYSWAGKRGSIATNPFERLPVAPTIKRDRVLTDGELAAVWRATDGAGPFNQIVRLLLLTGQRREEVGTMSWEEISDDRSTWTIPGGRAKNGRPHMVALSDAARAIIGERSKGLVFGSFNGWSKQKAALDARMLVELRKLATERGDDPPTALEPWRLHDLRRTMATGLQRLGVRLEVTEAILNHVGGSRAGIVGIYQRHDWADEKRAALGAWAAHVVELSLRSFQD